MGTWPNALKIPFSQLERRLTELPADQEIDAYCRGSWCVIAFEAVGLLRQLGYRARRLEDGFPEWKTAGLPIGHTPWRMGSLSAMAGASASAAPHPFDQLRLGRPANAHAGAAQKRTR